MGSSSGSDSAIAMAICAASDSRGAAWALAWKPARSTAAISSWVSGLFGEWMVARSLARLTLASSTPGTARSARSTRPAHEAQLIPPMSSVVSKGGSAGFRSGVFMLAS